MPTIKIPLESLSSLRHQLKQAEVALELIQNDLERSSHALDWETRQKTDVEEHINILRRWAGERQVALKNMAHYLQNKVQLFEDADRESRNRLERTTRSFYSSPVFTPLPLEIHPPLNFSPDAAGSTTSETVS